MNEPYCPYCQTHANQHPELIRRAKAEGTTPADEARADGTYNPDNGHFCCTMCYIRIGQPSSPFGWTAH